MEYTKNLKLKQPEYLTAADIADINDNMSTIDTAFENLKNADTTHESNFSNPHKVTKTQVGLGNVDNTADKDKNVLSASKLTNAVRINDTAFDGTKNIDIVANPKRISIASDADLNEITTQGEYIANYNNNCLNKPTGVKGFALKVYWNIIGSPLAVTQVLYPSIGAIPMCFIRKGNSNGWADWQEVSTVGHTHTQADITDFNKPTPLKLLEDATEIDLNNIKTTGIYTSVTQTNYLHCPTTLVTDSSSKPNYAFSLLVLGSRVYGSKDTISYYTQICIDNFGGQGQNQTWIRTYYGNAGWTIWYSIYSAKNKPTLEDITGSTVLPVSKGGTGVSTISAGYALVGNGTNPVNLRYIRNDILQNSSDLVTSGAVYTALNTKADKEKISEFEESLSATDSSVTDLSNTVDNLNKFYYLVGASDSDENLITYCDITCTGVKDDIIIQTLIDKVPEGSEIKFLSGNYNLSASLKLNKPLSIIGSGLKTVFTSTTKSSSGLGCQSTFSINTNGGQAIAGVQLSNLKISGGLCKINGNYVSGDGTKFDIEYPTGYPNSGTATIPMIIVGNVNKLKLDSIQFENKLVSNTRSAVGDWNCNPSVWTIYIRDCFHSNNGTFNGYFIDTGARESSITDFTVLTLALSGCDCTGSLCINLPAKENKDNVLDNSFDVKYYINGAEE